MSGSPGRVLDDIAVDLPRPRTDALLGEPAFIEAERQIRDLLRATS